MSAADVSATPFVRADIALCQCRSHQGEKVLRPWPAHYRGPCYFRTSECGIPLSLTAQLAHARRASQVEKATRIGARYHADIIQYIPRAESIEWRERISNIIADLNTGLQWELVGSYRRGVPLSSDLDVICWHPEVDGHKGHEERVKELLDSLVDRMLSGECC